MKTKLFKLLLLLNCLFLGFASFAQEQNVSGVVTDINGVPMAGVNIIIKGTNEGVMTNFDGEYNISAATGDILVFTYIGTKTQEISVGASDTYDVSMEEDSSLLDEVVVVGYGTTSKKNLTTSIAQVDPENIQKAAVSNTSQLLLGQAAGLQATMASAQPGGGINISIRGSGTPLYVVDGVVMPNESLEGGDGGSTLAIPESVNRSPLAGLNPDDIESIEILKDASASIYGIGAANGVVLITTKSGKSGKLNVSYRGSTSIVRNYDYLEPLGGMEYMNLVNAFSREQYIINNQMGIYGDNQFDGGWSPEFSDSEIAAAETTNFLDEILRDGLINNHSVVVNGGTDKINYYLSGNYFDNEGSVSNAGMKRYTLRSNVSAELSPWLKLTNIMNINRSTFANSTAGVGGSQRGAQAAGALTGALSYPAYLPIRDEDGLYSQFLNIPNPISLQEIDDNTFSNGIFMNFVADVTVIENMLTARLSYGNNQEHTRRSTFIPDYVYFDQEFQSKGNVVENDRLNQTFEASVNFNHQIGDIIDYDVVVGVGKYLASGTGLSVAYTGINNLIGNDDLAAITGNRNPGSERYKDERRSQFARASFDILDRYVIQGTLRRDGTDKFFPDQKYALFPAVSAAWKITNEAFLDNVDWLGLLKLRASYGVTGNDNLGERLYGTFSPSGSLLQFNSGGVVYPAYVQDGVDYPNVSWEKTTMKNLGVDFYLFNDRVNGSFDIYQNDVTDLLAEANSPGLSQFDVYPINGGHIRRQGWDASLNTVNIQTPDFRWNSQVTLSRVNTLWIERAPNYFYEPYRITEEEPDNIRYFYGTTGIVNNGLSNVPDSQPEDYRRPGFPIIEDVNGDGIIDIDDIQNNNEIPDLYFGFGNAFAYKNFDLNIFLYSQLGVNRYNPSFEWASALALANQTSSVTTEAFGLFHSELNPNGRFPGLAYEQNTVALPENVGTDLRFQDASFVRVRNITLGYNFRQGVLGTAINNMRIYLDAQNPIVFTNYEGFDPEIVNDQEGRTLPGEYPQTSTYSIGLEINF